MGTSRRFKYPAHYRFTAYSCLLPVLWFASGYTWFVLTQARHEVGAWVRLSIILGIAFILAYFLFRFLKSVSRVVEVDMGGLRLLLWGRLEDSLLWSQVREIRESQQKRRMEILAGEDGKPIPVEYQLSGYDELRQFLTERTGH